MRPVPAEPLLADGLWGCLLHTGYPISPLEATTRSPTARGRRRRVRAR